MSQNYDPERRSALKKILIGGAAIGSAALFGNVLTSSLSKTILNYSYGESSGIDYPGNGISLPKPASRPSLLYTASGQAGTSSLQLAVIAGILARNKPQIFLKYNNRVDSAIQESLSRNHGVSFNGSKSLGELVSLFGHTACGTPARWIRYDKGYDMHSTAGQNDAIDQLNAVRTMCGVYDAFPVPVGEKPPIAAAGSPMFDISKWGTSVPLYQKVWNSVSGRVTKSWIGINPPSGGTLRTQMTDYMVLSRAFSFQLPMKQLSSSHPTPQEQKNFAATILNHYPTPCVALGYVGLGQPGGGSNEVDFVAALSGGSRAKNSVLAGSSPTAHGGFYYSGAQQAGNMSVQSALAPYSGKALPSPASIPRYSSSQKYITIIASQGDVLDWVENPLLNYMMKCQSARMPIGITMTQVTQWLTPAIVDYYVDHISSTSGIVSSGSAGAGYNHVTELPNAAQFLGEAAHYAANVNARDFFFIDGPGVDPLAGGATVAREYISHLQAGGITPRSCMWWSPVSTAPSIVNGVPCFFTAIPISETNLKSQAECNTAIRYSINKAKSNFIVMILNTRFPDPGYLKNACQRSHNGVADVMPLTPGTFANLFRTAHGLGEIK